MNQKMDAIDQKMNQNKADLDQNMDSMDQKIKETTVRTCTTSS